MKKVYIVTSGDYSDYGIEAVFDSKKLAEEYINKYKELGFGSCKDIEEWNLNPKTREIKKGFKPYMVRMDHEGILEDIMDKNISWGFDGLEDCVRFDYKKSMTLFCFAKDENHAVKITNEKRIDYIKSNLWPS